MHTEMISPLCFLLMLGIGITPYQEMDFIGTIEEVTCKEESKLIIFYVIKTPAACI